MYCSLCVTKIDICGHHSQMIEIRRDAPRRPIALPLPSLAEPLPDLRAVDDALLARLASQRVLRMGLLEERRAAG